MSLPWVRIDSNIAGHDKILQLLADPSAKRWQAAFSYVCSIGWAGEHGTDGAIPPVALGFCHATPATARLLVTHRLWKETGNGWEIVNYGERQQLTAITAGKMEARRVSSLKANCVRHHGKDCWHDGAGCSVA
jgi:hypothetical protein